MRLHLQDGSRVFIDLRATGLLRAMAHSPTLTARPERVTIDSLELGESGESGVVASAGQGHVQGFAQTGVEASFRADAIAGPGDIPASDREKMVENLRSGEVLDARRFPTIDFRGRYGGTLAAGTLSGDLRIRGAARPISMGVRVSREAGDILLATASWEGRLTDLGIKPFKALLGAIKLQDWIGLRVEVRLRGEPSAEAPGET